jgi:hypothetical protein
MPDEIEARNQAVIALMADQSAFVVAALLFGGHAIGDPAEIAPVDQPESAGHPQERRIAAAAAVRDGAPTLFDAA